MSFFIGEIHYSLRAPDDGALGLIRFGNFDNDFLRSQNPACRGGVMSVGLQVASCRLLVVSCANLAGLVQAPG